MRHMMLMIPKGYEKAEPGTMPDAMAVAAMMKYNESLQEAGVLLSLDGLHPPAMGARVSFCGEASQGNPRVRRRGEGGAWGYWMIQTNFAALVPPQRTHRHRYDANGNPRGMACWPPMPPCGQPSRPWHRWR